MRAFKSKSLVAAKTKPTTDVGLKLKSTRGGSVKAQS